MGCEPAADAAEAHAAGGTVTTALAFDRDRLLKQLGPFSIERTGPGGAQSAVRLDADGLALTTTRDALGRPDSKKLAVGGAERFAEKLTYDNAGRVRSATMAGATRSYDYDGAGSCGRSAAVGDRCGRRGVRLRRRRQPHDAPLRRRRGETATYGAAVGRLASRGRHRLHVRRRRLPDEARQRHVHLQPRAASCCPRPSAARPPRYVYDALGRRTARQGWRDRATSTAIPPNVFRVTAWRRRRPAC